MYIDGWEGDYVVEDRSRSERTEKKSQACMVLVLLPVKHECRTTATISYDPLFPLPLLVLP